MYQPGLALPLYVDDGTAVTLSVHHLYQSWGPSPDPNVDLYRVGDELVCWWVVGP